MRRALAGALAVLCLAGCASTPTPSPSPTAAPSPTPTPSPVPTPTEEPKELWGFPIDNTHDAFEVDTGGKLGTVLVTVELDEESAERYDYQCALSVWCKDDLSTPIQTVTKEGVAVGQYRDLLDANFDGYTDFCYVIYPGAKNNEYCLYTWDEELGQFRFAANFLGHELELHEETQTLVNWSNGAGSDKVRREYCWENGELVCFQSETFVFLDDAPQSVEHVIYELIDGEMVETLRETYAMQGL